MVMIVMSGDANDAAVIISGSVLAYILIILTMMMMMKIDAIAIINVIMIYMIMLLLLSIYLMDELHHNTPPCHPRPHSVHKNINKDVHRLRRIPLRRL